MLPPIARCLGRTDTPFTVWVGPVPGNHPPVILGQPAPTTLLAGQTFLYDVQAVDPDHDPLTYSLAPTPVPPADLQLDSATGQITWATTEDDLGDASFTVQVVSFRQGCMTRSG